MARGNNVGATCASLSDGFGSFWPQESNTIIIHLSKPSLRGKTKFVAEIFGHAALKKGEQYQIKPQYSPNSVTTIETIISGRTSILLTVAMPTARVEEVNKTPYSLLSMLSSSCLLLQSQSRLGTTAEVPRFFLCGTELHEISVHNYAIT